MTRNSFWVKTHDYHRPPCPEADCIHEYRYLSKRTLYRKKKS
jgi:hypothetical protein